MDKSFIPALIGVVCGALVAIFGWFVSSSLSFKRESAARRDIAARAHLENQIEQLYGPLLGLIQYSRGAFDVAAKKLPTNATGGIDHSRFAGADGEIWRFFTDNYFLPVNAEIRQLIRSKIHLLESGKMPPSFEDFFRHQVEFEALHKLRKQTGVPSPEIEGAGWPKEFEAKVKEALDRLRLQHQEFLLRVGASGNK